MFANPGFELPAYGQDIGVTGVNGTASFYGNQQSNDTSADWAGATCSVRVGTCSDRTNNYCWNNSTSASTGGCSSGGTCNAGTTFTLSAYSGSGPGTGVNCGRNTVSKNQKFICSGNCPTLVGPTTNSKDTNSCWADAVGCRTTNNPGTNIWNGGTGWFPALGSAMQLTTSEHFQGKSSMRMNTSGGAQDLHQSWDNAGKTQINVCEANPAIMCMVNRNCPSGDTCRTRPLQAGHPVVGANWQFLIYAMTPAANMECVAKLARERGNTSLNHTFSLTGDGAWHHYSVQFTGKDASGQVSQLDFDWTCSGGGIVYVDNAFLGRTANVTNWRNEIVRILKTMKVGSLRYMNGDTSGDVMTEEQEVSSNPYLVPPTGEVVSSGTDQTALLSYNDVAVLAHAVSSTTSPWFSMPEAWPDADYAALGNKLCSWESTYDFPAIWLECGNEDWNGANNPYEKIGGGGGGGDVLTPAYGAACARAFRLISRACNDSHLHYLINNQSSNGGIAAAAMAGMNGTAGFPDTSQYGFSENMYSYGTRALTAAMPIQIAIRQFMLSARNNASTYFSPSNLFSDAGTVCNGSPPCNRRLAGYEWAPQGDGGGNNNPKVIGSLVSAGWGSAGISMQTMLGNLVVARRPQIASTSNFFQLIDPSAGGWAEWSVTAGYSPTNKNYLAGTTVWPPLRGTGLALELYNSAARGNYYPILELPSGVYGAAFCSTGQPQCNAVLSNLNNSPTQVSIVFPNGSKPPTIGKTVLYTDGMADNNEATNSIYIGRLPGSISQSGQEVSFTAPPLSALALFTDPTP